MFPQRPIRPINILLVEDNLADIRLTREALEDGKINNTLNVVMDGEEAMLYLKKLDKHPDFPTPDLILLDLNLPKIDGKDLLTQIKNDSKLSLIPVIVLTTSSSEHDILDSYTNHANSYLIKPIDFDQLVNLVKSIEDFWFTIVKLPTTEN